MESSVDLVADNLQKAFKRRPVLCGVSLRVAPGEIVGLLGPNGAGKTTAFRIMLGLLAQDGGTVSFGDELDGSPLHVRARRGLGYLPQGFSVFRGLSVEHNLQVVLEARGHTRPRDRVDALLERFSLTDLRRQKAGTLSGGETRRLEFARALCSEPRVLLCDEPFSGVDPRAVEEISRSLSELAGDSVGILLTDHNVHGTLDLCERIYVMDAGRIVSSGDPLRVVEDPVARRVYLGDRFRGLDPPPN